MTTSVDGDRRWLAGTNLQEDQRRSLRLAFLVPAITILIGGWMFRWMSDDGFIYLRVVEQLLTGNGPIFNRGIRVEVATGPLWVGLLAFFHLSTRIRLEWVAVLLGLGLATVGLGLAGLAAVRATGQRWAFWGAEAFALIPFAWHFATSGLETGLAYAWVGAVSLAVVTLRSESLASSSRAGILIGLGPLIRPDFALISGILMVWLVVSRRGVRSRLRFLISTLSIPLAYQVFRMAYYRAVVPNTAIAKSAAGAYWSQGLKYLVNTITNPLALALIIIGVLVLAQRAGNPALRALAIAGVVYTMAVVRGGGDFMRMRLFLPGLLILAVVAPGLARLRSINHGRWVLVLATLGLLDGLPAGGPIPAPGVSSERAYYSGRDSTSDRTNPITVEDFTAWELAVLGMQARETAVAGGSRYWERLETGLREIPAEPPLPVAALVEQIGLFGFAAGPDVYVVDYYSISDPVGARLEISERARPGHDKVQPRSWLDAAAGIDSPDGHLAAEARSCGRLASLIWGISAPFDLEVAWRNFNAATTDSLLTIPSDPRLAVEKFCPGPSQ